MTPPTPPEVTQADREAAPPMIDPARFHAMTDAQLADELDAMVDAVIVAKLKGPAEMVEICALVPLLTQRLRKSAEYVAVPRLD